MKPCNHTISFPNDDSDVTVVCQEISGHDTAHMNGIEITNYGRKYFVQIHWYERVYVTLPRGLSNDQQT